MPARVAHQPERNGVKQRAAVPHAQLLGGDAALVQGVEPLGDVELRCRRRHGGKLDFAGDCKQRAGRIVPPCDSAQGRVSGGCDRLKAGRGLPARGGWSTGCVGVCGGASSSTPLPAHLLHCPVGGGANHLAQREDAQVRCSQGSGQAGQCSERME